jgi:hypothetical protein
MWHKSLQSVIFSFCLLASLLLSATEPSPGVLGAEDLKRVVPASYFFRGQSAAVQLRNAAGIRASDGKLVLVGLVDTSGYSSDVAEKYQGFLITEVKLSLEGSELPPGQYGFGFSKQDKFTVMDVGNNDLLSIPSHLDQNLQRAVPLKIVADQGSYRLYAGKKWISLKAQ